MWHEARKQEKKLREAMVDYRKRAERRRIHYDKMRGDPNQLIRIHGNKCKPHLDLSKGGVDTTMIPWQGDTTNMISRYDVRIHMDYIPDYSKLPDYEPSREEKIEEGRCHYERYRQLVQNKFHGVSESEALARIEVEEMYPSKSKDKGKQKSQAKAAIAYTYQDDSDSDSSQAKRDEQLLAAYLGEEVEKEKAFSSESEYEVDMDVDDLEVNQVDKLNVMALEYGVPAGLFSKSLRAEKSHLEEQKLARMNDLEKSSLTGKKARRERKLLKERQLRIHMSSPPLYARRGSPTYEPYEPEERQQRHVSSSRSSSPEVHVGKVEFITEFGGGTAEAQVPERRQLDQSSDAREKSSHRTWHHSSSPPSHSPHSSHSHRRRRSRSWSRERGRNHTRRRSDYRSRSRSRSRDRRRRRRFSPSRSQDRHHSYRRRSHSRSPRPRKSPSRSRSPRIKRSPSHSPPPRRSTSRSPRPRNRSKSPVPDYHEKKTEKIKTVTQPAKTKNKAKLTPQERLKKRMQAQLSKQFKMDKKVQREKEEQKEVERIEREDELRDQMRKLRDNERTQWEREHGEYHSRQSRSPSPLGYYHHHDYYGN